MRREQAVARGKVRGSGVLIHLQISFSDRRQLQYSFPQLTGRRGPGFHRHHLALLLSSLIVYLFQQIKHLVCIIISICGTR